MRIEGLGDLLRELQEVPQEISKRVLKGMVAKGASVIRREAVRRAPMYTGADADLASVAGGRGRAIQAGHPPPGTLKRAIYQARLSDKCSETLEVWCVDVRRGKRAQSFGKAGENLDAYYALWVEFGHYTRVPHAMTATAKAAGRALGEARWVPAQPYMRPAFETKKDEALNVMRQYLIDNLPLALAASRILKAG